MSLCKNEITDTLRKLLNDWLIEKDDQPFTVRDVSSDFEAIPELSGVNLTKAISNELIRHRSSNRLVCVGKEDNPIGRPSFVYRQRWCNHTLDILKRELLESKFEVRKGEVRIFVYGCGMLRILKGFNVTVKKNAAELIDYHLKKISK